MSTATPPTRRDFLYHATAGAGVVAAGAAVWPLVDQMNPAAGVVMPVPLRVDVSGVRPGTQLTVKWMGRPYFIRRRTRDEIARARATDPASLPDPAARNANLPATALTDDRNRTLDAAGEWLVVVGVCTHLGCIPIGDAAGDFGGWFCPCHGGHFDASGRVRHGPPPRNLAVPRARLEGSAVILEDRLVGPAQRQAALDIALR